MTLLSPLLLSKVTTENEMFHHQNHSTDTPSVMIDPIWHPKDWNGISTNSCQHHHVAAGDILDRMDYVATGPWYSEKSSRYQLSYIAPVLEPSVRWIRNEVYDWASSLLRCWFHALVCGLLALAIRSTLLFTPATKDHSQTTPFDQVRTTLK